MLETLESCVNISNIETRSISTGLYRAAVTALKWTTREASYSFWPICYPHS